MTNISLASASGIVLAVSRFFSQIIMPERVKARGALLIEKLWRLTFCWVRKPCVTTVPSYINYLLACCLFKSAPAKILPFIWDWQRFAVQMRVPFSVLFSPRWQSSAPIYKFNHDTVEAPSHFSFAELPATDRGLLKWGLPRFCIFELSESVLVNAAGTIRLAEEVATR